jgi:hypothetical protein
MDSPGKEHPDRKRSYKPVFPDFASNVLCLKNAAWRDTALLMASRAEYGLMSDHPVILVHHLRDSLKYFLIQAIGLVTYRNARILGIDHCLGTVAPGRLQPRCLGQGPVSSGGVSTGGRGRRKNHPGPAVKIFFDLSSRQPDAVRLPTGLLDSMPAKQRFR